MEVEENEVEIIGDSLPVLFGGFQGSNINEPSIQTSTWQLGSILQEDRSARGNAGYVSNYQDVCVMENPRNENIHHQAFTQQEDSSGIVSSVDKCVVCGEHFFDFGELMIHFKSHFQETGDGASASTGTAGKQTETGAAKKKTKDYTCYLCEKSLSSGYSLSRHIEFVHIGSNLANVCTCRYCHTVVDSHKLRKHVIETHIRVENYLQHCLVCLAVTAMNQTSDTLSSFSSRIKSTHVNQSVNLMNFEESSQALLTCADCGSSQVHKVKYKSHKKNCLMFECDQCSAVDIKSCFVKLTYEDEKKYQRHKSICALCRFQKDKVENIKKCSQNSRQEQAFGQFSGSIDTIELSDENEACNPVSEEESIIICSDDENVCDTTCRVSSVSPENDSIEFLGSCIESDSSCDKDDIEVVKEYITDASREKSLAWKEAEHFIAVVESELSGQVQGLVDLY